MSNQFEKVSEGRRNLSRKERKYNPMRSREEVEDRLNGFYKKYRSVSGDNIDPEIEASIRELKWVLRVGKTK